MFLVFDLTFHGQWQLFQVRRQLSCSDGFACLGSHTFLVNGMGASFCRCSVVATCQNVLPSCAGYLAHLSQDLYSRGDCTRITTLGQLPAAMV